MKPNQEHLPTPGSHEALEIGCTCPVVDNNYGDGVIYVNVRKFWYNENCSVHTFGKHVLDGREVGTK